MSPPLPLFPPVPIEFRTIVIRSLRDYKKLRGAFPGENPLDRQLRISTLLLLTINVGQKFKFFDFMFQHLGEFAGALIMLGFGTAAYFKPYHMVGVEGSPEAIQKRIRFMKRCGIVLIICGGALSIFALYDLVVWLVHQRVR